MQEKHFSLLKELRPEGKPDEKASACRTENFTDHERKIDESFLQNGQGVGEVE